MTTEENLNLDRPETYLPLDSENMLTHLHNFPSLCRQAWKIAGDFQIPANFYKIDKIVILGMGGSAIGGDLVGSLVQIEAGVLVRVCRDYHLPGFVDRKTLVIASSYSGNTEETLATFKQALARTANLLAITNGGELKDLCLSRGIPCITIDYQCQPRAALPFSFFILLGILQKAGLVRDYSQDFSDAIDNLAQMASKINENTPSGLNPAKGIAGKLKGRLAVIYGAEITTEVAHRWKTQINELSKSAAYYEFLPELNHNSVVGYPLPAEVNKKTMVVMLDSALLHPRVRLRFDVTRKLLDQSGIPSLKLEGEGLSALSQMMTLVLLGDYMSYYLALLNRVDPTPVQAISFLKNSLAGR
jgi:glucose/mannose-6-phosphate isomerase